MSGCEINKRILCIEDKLRVFQRLDACETATKIAKELQSGVSTITDWEKDRKQI